MENQINMTDDKLMKRVEQIQMFETERKFRRARKQIEEFISYDNIKRRTQIELCKLYDSITMTNIDSVMDDAKRILNEDRFILTRDELTQMAINLEYESMYIFLWVSIILAGVGCFFIEQYELAIFAILFPFVMIVRLISLCDDLKHKIEQGTRIISSSNTAPVIF